MRPLFHLRNHRGSQTGASWTKSSHERRRDRGQQSRLRVVRPVPDDAPHVPPGDRTPAGRHAGRRMLRAPYRTDLPAHHRRNHRQRATDRGFSARALGRRPSQRPGQEGN